MYTFVAWGWNIELCKLTVFVTPLLFFLKKKSYLSVPCLSYSMWESLAIACGIYNYSIQTLSCHMWDLVPWPGIEPRPPCIGTVKSEPLNHQGSPTTPFLSKTLLVNCMFHLEFQIQCFRFSGLQGTTWSGGLTREMVCGKKSNLTTEREHRSTEIRVLIVQHNLNRGKTM